MKRQVGLALIVLSWISIANAQQQRTVPGAAAAPQGATPSAARQPQTGSQDPSDRKFKRSRYTSDKTQMTADRRTLVLSTGEDRPVEVDFNISDSKMQISTADGSIVIPQTVSIGDKTQLVFKPLKEGVTSVTVRDNEGEMRLIFTVRVTANNLMRSASEVRQILQDIEGLEVRVVGKKVIVEGDIITPEDYGMVQRVIHDEVYDKLVIDKTKLSAMALTLLARRIQDEINVFAKEVRTRVVNGVIFLEGTVDSLDNARRAEKVAFFYLPEVRPQGVLEKADDKIQKGPKREMIYNALLVNPPPPKKLAKLIRVRFDFVELNKDYGKVFGFKWAPGFSSGAAAPAGGDNLTFGPTDGSAGFSGVISKLLPRLNWLTTAGYGRVLRTSNVIVRSGEKASLKDKRTYSFTVQSAQGVGNVATQDVGFTAGVTPKIVGQTEDIDMEIKFEQGNPVTAPTNGRPPVVATHQVETQVYVKSGESAAVGGLESTTASTAFNTDDPEVAAAAGKDPPIVTMIHSKNYNKIRSQFVIFVTPQIVENASDGTDDLKKNFRIKVR